MTVFLCVLMSLCPYVNISDELDTCLLHQLSNVLKLLLRQLISQHVLDSPRLLRTKEWLVPKQDLTTCRCLLDSLGVRHFLQLVDELVLEVGASNLAKERTALVLWPLSKHKLVIVDEKLSIELGLIYAREASLCLCQDSQRLVILDRFVYLTKWTLGIHISISEMPCQRDDELADSQNLIV